MDNFVGKTKTIDVTGSDIVSPFWENVHREPAASHGRLEPLGYTNKRVEREFVVDSVASMHVVSKKDLYSAELETVRASTSPTTLQPMAWC